MNWKYSLFRVSSKREKCPPRVETAAAQTANDNHGKRRVTWPKEDVFRTSAKSLFWKFTLCLTKVKLHREKSCNFDNQEECWNYFLEQIFKHLRRFFFNNFLLIRSLYRVNSSPLMNAAHILHLTSKSPRLCSGWGVGDLHGWSIYLRSLTPVTLHVIGPNPLINEFNPITIGHVSYLWQNVVVTTMQIPVHKRE